MPTRRLFQVQARVRAVLPNTQKARLFGHPGRGPYRSQLHLALGGKVEASPRSLVSLRTRLSLRGKLDALMGFGVGIETRSLLVIFSNLRGKASADRSADTPGTGCLRSCGPSQSRQHARRSTWTVAFIRGAPRPVSHRALAHGWVTRRQGGWWMTASREGNPRPQQDFGVGTVGASRAASGRSASHHVKKRRPIALYREPTPSILGNL